MLAGSNILLLSVPLAFGLVGNVTAEQHLFEDGIAPGTWSVFPNVLVSGETTNLELRYIQGSKPLPAGAYHRILIEPLSVKTLFHCPPSTDLEVVPYIGALPDVKLQPKPVHGVGFRDVKIIFPDGLKAGTSFAVVIGNKDSDGQVRALVNPVPVHNLTFEIYSGLSNKKTEFVKGEGYEDPWNKPQYKEYDWQLMGWAYALPRIDIMANKASALRLFAPSLVEPDKKFDLRIAVTDDFDSRAFPVYQDKVIIEPAKAVNGLINEVVFTLADSCTKLVKGLSISKPGIYRIKARLAEQQRIFESNPIVVRATVDASIYWGNIHNHGWYSECWGDNLDTFYGFARDISGMDFVGLSDHRGSLPRKGEGVSRLLRWRLGRQVDSLEAWMDTIEKANKYNEPPKFVTLFGYEWSSMDTGHNNVYFAEASVESMERLFTSKYTDYGFTMRELLRKSDSLFIPHKHADVFPYATLVEMDNAAGKPLTPVIEVYSDWGDIFYPFGKWDPDSRFGGTRNKWAHSYLWALENGYHLAAIGDSDSHTGLPGRRNPGGIAPHHDHPQGLTAVMTNDYTREGITNAYQNRQVYATTGERIFLDVRSDSARMGDTLYTDERFSIEVEVAGTDLIESISLYDGLKLVAKKLPDNERDVVMSFDGLLPTSIVRPYVVAVVQKDENRAYATPIWVRRASVPDLTWQEDADGTIYLINKGTAPAEDVSIWYSETEHPFTAAAIPGRECGWEDTAGFVWTDPKDNQKTVFHYRWHGEPIKGRVTMNGLKSYAFEFNRDFLFLGGKLDDHGDGTADFATGKMYTATHSHGFDIIAEVVPDRPAFVEIALECCQITLIGEENIKADRFRVALNGRKTNQKLCIETIGVVQPGQKRMLPHKYLGTYCSADPQNTIIESDETNNLWVPGGWN